MAAIPNLTQFFGKRPDPPPVNPDGSTSTAPVKDADGFPLDFSMPSAWENPDLWDSVLLTDATNADNKFMLPPVGMGKVSVKTPKKVKLDTKGGAGKAKPKTTKTGGDATKDKITVEAVEEAWPYILAASRAITPGSGPWNVSHPKYTLAAIMQIEIEAWTDAPDFDAHGQIKWELSYSEVTASAQNGNGGGTATDTPDADNAQRGTVTVTGFGGNDNTITYGSNPAVANPNSGAQKAAQAAAGAP